MSEAEQTERGAVFTHAAVVEAMLDLVGYRAGSQLWRSRLLEPSFGEGDFLLPAVERLIESARSDGLPASLWNNSLSSCIFAVEINKASFSRTFARLMNLLIMSGCTAESAQQLCSKWLVQDDFLLTSIEGAFDFVIGNPPYIRQERIPKDLLAEYRKYTTFYDRADLYIPFFERSLKLLKPNGQHAFICTNRWVKNKYGGPLRELITREYHLATFCDVQGCSPFLQEVTTYPAITHIQRRPSGPTYLRTLNTLENQAKFRVSPATSPANGDSERTVQLTVGNAPWILEHAGHQDILRDLELNLPTLEEAGCQVGIGVATGADKVFIGNLADLPVEPDRCLPLVMAGDLQGNQLRWSGKGVVNPFHDNGQLVPLSEYPKLSAYFSQHAEVIKARHCAQKAPQNWYRTIDRISPSLANTPKLLIPDIKGEPTVVYDSGGYYPHHNLYHITSDTWDLPSLAVILRSSIATFFVSSYCTKMAGGFLRFQAQYLRRIRVPNYSSLNAIQRNALTHASLSIDLTEIDKAAQLAYNLDDETMEMIQAIACDARIPRKVRKS